MRGADSIDLLLHVAHLKRQPVTQALQRFHVRASPQLLFELPIHAGIERVQRVEAGFDLFRELLVTRDARHLPVEIIRNRDHVSRFLRSLIHHGELARNRIHPRVQLRHLPFELANALKERFERCPIGCNPVAHL